VIDPIAFQIGPLQVHWYGIIIASAVLLAALLGARVAKSKGEDPEQGWSMLLFVVLVAVVGARIYHVIHEWEFYSENPALIPQVWNGGIGIPGAIAGGALAIWAYTRWQGLNAARWLDIFAPATLLGQAIGRLGNFVNQELYGGPTTLPWGVPIDGDHRIAAYADLNAFPVETTRFHPLFAYEAVLNLIGMGVLLYVGWRFARRLYAGDIILMYIMWYSAVRFALEPFRSDNWVIAGVPTAMWLAAIAFAAAGAFLIVRHVKGWGSPSVRPAEETDLDAQTDDAAAAHRPGTEPSTG
jgi:phosphatidylglycerol:prolipoprotein diacylglycerol transferase